MYNTQYVYTIFIFYIGLPVDRRKHTDNTDRIQNISNKNKQIKNTILKALL